MLSQYYWPESFRINEVVASLRRVGCHITVLTGQPNYPRGIIFDGYHAGSFGVQQHGLGYSIYRVPLMPRGRGGAIGLAANYLSFVLSAGVLGTWLLRKKQFDVILSMPLRQLFKPYLRYGLPLSSVQNSSLGCRTYGLKAWKPLGSCVTGACLLWWPCWCAGFIGSVIYCWCSRRLLFPR